MSTAARISAANAARFNAAQALAGPAREAPPAPKVVAEEAPAGEADEHHEDQILADNPQDDRVAPGETDPAPRTRRDHATPADPGREAPANPRHRGRADGPPRRPHPDGGDSPPDGRGTSPAPPPGHPARPTAGQPVDGLALWDAEDAAAACQDLGILRIDQNERLFVPFTTSMIRADLHYLDFAEPRGYLRCNGPGCLLCRVGRRLDERDLLPVYDILSRAVAVLPIAPTLRAHSLRPQLVPVLRRVSGGEGPLLVTLRKEDDYKIMVAARPLPDGADDGAAVVRDFLERFKARLIDLRSPYQQLADEELATIPEVRALMIAKGIEL